MPRKKRMGSYKKDNGTFKDREGGKTQHDPGVW